MYTAPSLATLRLEGISFETSVLLEWLSRARNFDDIERNEELFVFISVDFSKLSEDENEVLDGMLEAFNEAAEGVMQLEVTKIGKDTDSDDE